MMKKKKKVCKEKLRKRKQGEAKWFDTLDDRFMEDPFEICVGGF